MARLLGAIPIGLNQWVIETAKEIPEGPGRTLYKIVEVPAKGLIAGANHVVSKTGEWLRGNLNDKSPFAIAREVTETLGAAGFIALGARHVVEGTGKAAAALTEGTLVPQMASQVAVASVSFDGALAASGLVEAGQGALLMAAEGVRSDAENGIKENGVEKTNGGGGKGDSRFRKGGKTIGLMVLGWGVGRILELGGGKIWENLHRSSIRETILDKELKLTDKTKFETYLIRVSEAVQIGDHEMALLIANAWETRSEFAFLEERAPVLADALTQLFQKLGRPHPSLILFSKVINSDTAPHWIDEGRRVVGKRPRSGEAHFFLGKALHAQARFLDGDEQSARFSEARQSYEESLRYPGEHAEVRNNLGVIAESVGDREGAKKYYHQAIQTNPDLSAPYQNLIRLLAQEAKSSSGAEELFGRKELKDIDLAAVHYQLGLDYYYQENFSRAEAHLKRALHLDPASADILNDLGLLYMHQERWEEAIPLFREVTELEPDFIRGFYNLGFSLLQKRDSLDDAIVMLEKAVELDRRKNDMITYVVHFNLGKAYLEKEQWKKAMEHLKIAVDLNPNNAWYRNDLALAYVKIGRLDEAIEQFEMAIRLEKNSIFYFYLGQAYEIRGEFELAITAYQRAIHLAPQFYQAHFKLAKIYYERKNYPLALQHSKQFLEIAPDTEQESRGQANKLIEEIKQATH